jgi:hypothetical protein
MENEDKILESLSGLQKATPPPYLTSKVLAKLSPSEHLSFLDRLLFFISKPSAVLASIIVLVVFNFLAIQRFDNHNTEETIDETTSINEFENNIAINYFNYTENEK